MQEQRAENLFPIPKKKVLAVRRSLLDIPNSREHQFTAALNAYLKDFHGSDQPLVNFLKDTAEVQLGKGKVVPYLGGATIAHRTLTITLNKEETAKPLPEVPRHIFLCSLDDIIDNENNRIATETVLVQSKNMESKLVAISQPRLSDQDRRFLETVIPDLGAREAFIYTNEPHLSTLLEHPKLLRKPAAQRGFIDLYFAYRTLYETSRELGRPFNVSLFI